MDLQNINWKLFLQDPATADPDGFFRAFNGWIPDSPEVFVDVSDYRHVHEGPWVFLAGHYVNYALDMAGGRPGLLYDRRQPMAGDDASKLAESLRDLFRAAARLEADPAFERPPAFATGELLFAVNNRAVAPNAPATFEALRPALRQALSRAYGGDGFTLEYRPGDPRGRFAVRVVASQPPPLAELAHRLD